MSKINRKARLIVRNVSFKATEESIKKSFGVYGIVQEIEFVKKDGKFVGCVFVQFDTKLNAEKAIKHLNNLEFHGRPIVVDWAVSKKIYDRVMKKKQKRFEKLKKKQAEDSMNDSKDVKIKDEFDDDLVELNKDENCLEIKDEFDDDKKDIIDEKKVLRSKSFDDVQEGKTIFVRNIPFSVKKEELKEFFKQFGPIQYAIVCIDSLTEHSKGTGFVKFYNIDDAEKCLNNNEPLMLEGNMLYCFKAKVRNELKPVENIGKKDSRNLYLLKEGVIIAGSKAAVNVSVNDMKKRIELERRKNIAIKNSIKFVSDRRLAVHNLPEDLTDKQLRKIFMKHSGLNGKITECRIMRDLNKLQPNGLGKSKQFGFVAFSEHKNALTALRTINNNPEIFSIHKRPIVSFSIEDKRALNIKMKRELASKQKNPYYNQDSNETLIESNETESRPNFQGFESNANSKNKFRSNHNLKEETNLHIKLTKVDRKKQLKKLELKKSNQQKKKKALERNLLKSLKLKNSATKKSENNILNKYEKEILMKNTEKNLEESLTSLKKRKWC